MTAIRKATGRITTAIVGTNSTRSRTISHRLLEASTSLEAWLRTCVVKIITPTKPNTARLRAATRRAIMREITRMSAFLPGAIRSDGLKAGKPCPHHGLPPSPIAAPLHHRFGLSGCIYKFSQNRAALSLPLVAHKEGKPVLAQFRRQSDQQTITRLAASGKRSSREACEPQGWGDIQPSHQQIKLFAGR